MATSGEIGAMRLQIWMGDNGDDDDDGRYSLKALFFILLVFAFFFT